MRSPSFAVPSGAPKRWWCRECKAPITDERGLVEMLCGFCLEDKAGAKARMTRRIQSPKQRLSLYESLASKRCPTRQR
jgi:hypothetical protein